MSKIGIIANPASGKDIRRLVSHATVIDNNEKVNIIERIILGAQKFGVSEIYIMPDPYMMGHKVIDKLQLSEELSVDITVLDMKMEASPNDTERAAEMMSKLNVGCVIVLGGDGTHRLVAKQIGDIPLIGISTGTNNAYPEMLEGTIAGMASAVVASKKFDIGNIYIKDKLIEIFKNGEFVDIALMDAVITDEIYVGSKAIWNLSSINQIIVSRCHPASIGFSAIVGVNCHIDVDDDYGGSLKINQGTNRFYAPISAGSIIEIESEEVEIVGLNKVVCWKSDYNGIIAVDGEREFKFSSGDEIGFKITRNGPVRVDIKKTLEMALKGNFFKS